MSQQYVLSGEAKDLEAAKHGEILFYREADLPPGVYTMETIVFDATAAQGSARVATLTVPPVEPQAWHEQPGARQSRRGSEGRTITGAGTTPPLYVGHSLLYPNLGEPIRKSRTAELPFYFTLYGDVRGATAQAELLRNGRSVAEAPIAAAARPGSRVQHVGRLPIGALPAGTYELRIKVTQAGREMSGPRSSR